MKTVLLLSTLILLTGCEQAYRYPCQNPENWNLPECNKPLCEVNRDCPELIFKENKNIMIPAPQEIPVAPKLPPKNGECK